MRSLFRTAAPRSTAGAEPVPTTFPTVKGAELAAVFLGKRVGGDFYDSIRVSPERVLIGLLDIAGRRDETRSLLVAAQEVFRTQGARLFAAEDINESDAMTELCLDLNRRLIEVCCGVHSCPAFLACYHEKFGTLCYTNAGHTPALLRDSTGITELGSTGLPLGLFSHATCEAPTVGLAPGSALLGVSRGIIDCEGRHNASSETFCVSRVKQIFQDSPATKAKDLCSSILNAVAKFNPEAALHDDQTALALVRAPEFPL